MPYFGISSSLVLITFGAVLAFAVSFDITGVSLGTVGLILIAVGLIWLAVSLFVCSDLGSVTSEPSGADDSSMRETAAVSDDGPPDDV